MRIIEEYRPQVTTVKGVDVELGPYDSYGEAYDAAILWASERLPREELASFVIDKVYVNAAC